MNGGAFGENFPYSNFHDLNMDWIIKIAKDFLDQYTNIQNTITEGLEGLDNKAQELENLLQQWYDTHSEDIANQLADALEDLNEWYTEHQNFLNQYIEDSIAEFETQADIKAAETLESIPSDYTNLSDNVNILKQDNFLNLSGYPITLGAISSPVLVDIPNHIPTISESTTRCILGPFTIEHSYKIICNPNKIKYKLYALYTDTPNSTQYCDLYTDWTTQDHIIGYNKFMKNKMFFYLQFSLPNNETIADMTIFRENIWFIENDDKNPYDIIWIESMYNGNPYLKTKQTIRAYTYIESMFTDTYLSSTAPGMRIGYKDMIGDGEKQSLHETAHIKNTNASVIFIGASALPWETATTFEELYNAIGLHTEKISKKDQMMLSGEAFTYLMNDYNNSIQKGNQFVDAVENYGVVLNNNGNNKYSHSPSMIIVNGYAYVCFQTDQTTAQESANTTEIQIAKINIYDYTDITYKTIASVAFSLGTLVFTKRPNNPQITLDGTKIHINFNGQTTVYANEQVYVHYIYDIETENIITSNICKFKVPNDSTEYVFTLPNFNNKIGMPYMIPSPDYEYIMSKATSDGNGKYYMALSSGNYKYGKTAIFSTTDFEVFTLVDVLDLMFGSDCESVVYYTANALIGASRHYYSESTLNIWKYNLITKKVENYIQIPDCNVRPTLFDYDYELYLSHGISDRQGINIYKVNTQNINNSKKIVDAHTTQNKVIGYTAYYEYNGHLYLAIHGTHSGSIQITFTDIGTLLA